MRHPHISDTTFRNNALRGRSLLPQEAQHLAACSECRGLESQIKALASWAMASDASHKAHAAHMTDAVLGGWLAGTLPPEDAQLVMLAIRDCSACNARLHFLQEDLQDWGISLQNAPLEASNVYEEEPETIEVGEASEEALAAPTHPHEAGTREGLRIPTGQRIWWLEGWPSLKRLLQELQAGWRGLATQLNTQRAGLALALCAMLVVGIVGRWTARPDVETGDFTQQLPVPPSVPNVQQPSSVMSSRGAPGQLPTLLLSGRIYRAQAAIDGSGDPSSPYRQIARWLLPEMEPGPGIASDWSPPPPRAPLIPACEPEDRVVLSLQAVGEGVITVWHQQSESPFQLLYQSPVVRLNGGDLELPPQSAQSLGDEVEPSQGFRIPPGLGLHVFAVALSPEPPPSSRPDWIERVLADGGIKGKESRSVATRVACEVK